MAWMLFLLLALMRETPHRPSMTGATTARETKTITAIHGSERRWRACDARAPRYAGSATATSAYASPTRGVSRRPGSRLNKRIAIRTARNQTSDKAVSQAIEPLRNNASTTAMRSRGRV